MKFRNLITTKGNLYLYVYLNLSLDSAADLTPIFSTS